MVPWSMTRIASSLKIVDRSSMLFTATKNRIQFTARVQELRVRDVDSGVNYTNGNAGKCVFGEI